jgi:hypothetical protein
MKEACNFLDKELDQAIFPTMGGGIEGLPHRVCNKLKKKRKRK